MNKPSLFIAFFLFYASASAASATTISQLDYNYAQNIYLPNSLNGVGQTFVATAERYEDIGVFLHAPVTTYADTTISFSLFEGAFATPVSTWANIDLSNLAPADGRLDIDISSFSFIPGGIYSFALFNDTAQWLVRYMKDPVSDHYTDGAMYLGFHGSFLQTFAYNDLKFEITAHPVPLPSTFALFSAGLFGLIPSLKKN